MKDLHAQLLTLGQNKNKSQKKRARWIRAAVRLNNNEICCHLCGVDFKSVAQITIDHVIPSSDGGPNSTANFRPAHKECNNARMSIPMPYFRMEQLFAKAHPNFMHDSTVIKMAKKESRRARKVRKKERARARRVARTLVICRPIIFVGLAA